MNEIAELLKTYQTWVVGAIGWIVHTVLRPDVPVWHKVFMLFIGLPMTVLFIAPAIAERADLTDTSEKTVVFLLALFGRDLLFGFTKLSKLWSDDPLKLLTFWQKGK